ncbi:alpha/beta fold hydrolase [Lentibacillus lipolyticus]|nr:alpha/beta fold hydrolase [Lentibacillus lipolyticus]
MNETSWLYRPDHTAIYMRKWEAIHEKPKAIVQIAHGMLEHIGRYHNFATFLTEHGITVYGNDHRGHGRTGENQGLFGYFADTDGFDKAAEDMRAVSERIKADYPNTPLFLLGHSMGSFLTRRYIQHNSELLQGVILTGTGYFDRAASRIAKQIAALLPQKEKAKWLNWFLFSSYNKRIPDNQTAVNWLTRDNTIIKEYLDDPYCGFVPTAGFFKDLMSGLTMIHDNSRNRRIPAGLPLLIISGLEDPVGGYAKGVWRTAQLYRNTGMHQLTVMFMEGGRHEILNEINRQEVYRHIHHWINSNKS